MGGAGKKIAIIGAGVAGMSAAWHLHQYGFGVKVFERTDRIGGDALTIDIVIGGERRWVDLGVNDFNARTYRHLVALFDDLGVQYRRLEESMSFGSLDGSVVYTVDGKWGTTAPETIRRDAERFHREAAEVLTDPTYRYALVKDYVKEKGFSDDFVRYNLYPRINGMYFGGRRGAGNMPVFTVMGYCSLQEGLGLNGPPAPERMYFVEGSGGWMAKLYDAARAKFPIVLNAEASVSAGVDWVDVHALGRLERFDKVVLASQAHDALRCFKTGLSPEVARFLGSFEHYDDEVVVHTYYGVLPPYVKAWRTYNILIRKNAAAPHPYTITYVVNRHQNDAQNPRYAPLGAPHFFVTVNPPVPIPDAHVLRRPDGALAKTMFRHVAYDLEAIKAQERRKEVQGVNNVYLTGGYTRGAGLHEKCWVDGMELAAHIRDRHQVHDSATRGRRYSRGDAQVALGVGFR